VDLTLTVNGPNRVIVAIGHSKDGYNVSSAAWDITAEPLAAVVKSQAGTCRTEIWYLQNPSTGTKSLRMGWTAAHEAILGAYVLNGATTPGATDTGNGSVTSYSKDLATLVGEIAIDGLSENSTTPTQGANQTEIYDYNPAAGLNGSSSYEIATGATTTMSYSGIDGGSNSNYACAIFHKSPAGRQVLLIQFQRWQEFIKDLKHGLVPPSELRRRYREAMQI